MWVHCFGLPFSASHADGSSVEQKAQEITQTFPDALVSGDPY